MIAMFSARCDSEWQRTRSAALFPYGYVHHRGNMTRCACAIVISHVVVSSVNMAEVTSGGDSVDGQKLSKKYLTVL